MEAIGVLIIAGFILVFFLILVLFGNMVVIVNGQQVGIVERRYFGRPLPAGRVVAVGGEVGFQARSLRPGLKLLVPFLYTVRKVDMITVGEEEVGLIESIDGQALEPGRIFARHISGDHPEATPDVEHGIRGLAVLQEKVVDPGQEMFRMHPAVIAYGKNIGFLVGPAMEIQTQLQAPPLNPVR